MFDEHKEIGNSDFIIDTNVQIQNDINLDYKTEDLESNTNKHLLFKDDEDLMVKETEIEKESRIKYFGDL